MAKIISLKPDHKLMNPDFDGYKLCSDADVAMYSQRVSEEGMEGRPSGPTCYLGTRLEALHNHLFPDPFHLSSVYYFTSRGHLLRTAYSQDSRLSGSEVVWQADLTDETEAQEEESEGGRGQYHATVSFPGADLALVSNGRGSLHLLHTGNRTTPTTNSWRVDFEVETARGVLIQSCARPTKGKGEGAEEEDQEGRVVECLLLSVTTPATLLSNPEYVVVDSKLAESKAISLHLITWLTLTYNGATWKVSRERIVAGEGAIQYCSIDGSASGLIILAHKNYSFVADSESPIIKPEKKNEEKDEEKEAPKFMFMQTDEDMTVWVGVGEAVKEDMGVEVTRGGLNVRVKEREALFGRFSHNVQHELSTWTLGGDGILEIVLFKAVEGERWETLFVGDGPVGEEVMEHNSDVNKRLTHLTSDQWNPDPSPEAPVYDPGELEACDQAGEEVTLTHLHGSTHTPLALAHLGLIQHLFNAQLQPMDPPAFCLRHDVDALLWQPRGCVYSEGEEEEVAYTHTATYDAFGYVRASKTSAKFTCASSDLSYVAVADTHTHIYIFCQPGCMGGGGELRNRKSGRRVGRVARQLVVTLKNHDPILGLYTAPGRIYVLTGRTLYVYCIPVTL